MPPGTQLPSVAFDQIVHALAMSVGAIVLAVICWRLHRGHRSPHLRLWTMAWACVVVVNVVGGVLLPLWGERSAGSATRIALSFVTQLAHYLQAVLMLLGAAALTRGRASPRRTQWAWIIACSVIVLAITLATISADPQTRLQARLVLRHFLVGCSFLVAASVLFHRHDPAMFGQRIVAGSFCMLGATSLCYVAWLNNGPTGATVAVLVESVNSIDLLSLTLAGIGLVLWSLEQQHAIVEQQAHDLSQRTRQLMASQKMEAIGRLAGGVAHDFNNLLTVILVLTEQMSQRTDLDAELSRGLQDLRQSAQQATKLTSQLLVLASNRTGEPRTVDLARLTTGLTTILRRLVGERLALHCEIPDTPCLVRLQPGHAEQVLLNLVVNARDATSEGGTVRIVVSMVEEASRRLVRLTVADNGIGMSEETQQRAMEPFFTTKGRHGTGLGLALVYGIAQQSGASVKIESAPLAGTRIHITWPAASGVPEDSEVRVVRLPSAPPAQTILVAEDEPTLLQITSRSLEVAGYKVLAAAHPDEALRVAATHPGSIDALLTDVLMPGMNGPELARAIQERRPGVKVMFVSGYVDARSRAQMDGDEPLLTKPFTRQQLLHYVQAQLAGHSNVG